MITTNTKQHPLLTALDAATADHPSLRKVVEEAVDAMLANIGYNLSWGVYWDYEDDQFTYWPVYGRTIYISMFQQASINRDARTAMLAGNRADFIELQLASVKAKIKRSRQQLIREHMKYQLPPRWEMWHLFNGCFTPDWLLAQDPSVWDRDLILRGLLEDGHAALQSGNSPVNSVRPNIQTFTSHPTFRQMIGTYAAFPNKARRVLW